MTTHDTVLEIPQVRGIGPATKRQAQPKKKIWPKGTTIISADSHFLEGDLWVDRFPEHLKHLAPRMVFRDGGWEVQVGTEKSKWIGSNRVLCELADCVPGFNNVVERLKDLDAEGVEKELLFPQRLLAQTMAGDIGQREHYYSAYNDYMSGICQEAPGRLYFAAIPNFWDPAQARASIEVIKSLRASALLVPLNPRNDVNGNPIFWSAANMAPFWSAVEESNLPMCFHIGEGLPNPFPGAIPAFAISQMNGLVPTWGALTFGGVFDRHPKLRVVFVEGGISWVPKMLQDADLVYNTFDPVLEIKLAHDPSWYWFNHCYASFMTDPAGLELLHRIGPERVMWSTDYPHPESTYGYTQDAIEAVLAATDLETAQKILGKTALKLFEMN